MDFSICPELSKDLNIPFIKYPYLCLWTGLPCLTNIQYKLVGVYAPTLKPVDIATHPLSKLIFFFLQAFTSYTHRAPEGLQPFQALSLKGDLLCLNFLLSPGFLKFLRPPNNKGIGCQLHRHDSCQ